ncbi:MAG: 50S ribosomal protein L18Ae [Candidatus Diapherotrites archaeon]
MKFELKGFFCKEKQKRPFCKKVEAPSEARAKEKLYSLFGSEHGIKRRSIKITEINKLGD